MRKISVLIFFCVLGFSCLYAQTNTFPSTGAAGIGTTTPDPSSLLEVVSTSKGILIPRMTQAQRDVVTSPATGLLIYQTNKTPGFYYYDGSKWTAVIPKGVNKSLSNLTGPTAVNVDLLPGVDNTTNLGSVAQSWKDVHVGGSIYLDGVKFIDNAGTSNTFLGNTTNTTNAGSYNTFAGELAGAQNVSTNNSFFGYASGSGNTTGFDNSFFGQGAGYSNGTGSSNSIFGKAAGYFNVSGSANTFFGYGAGYQNKASSNTFVGYRSGQSDTSGYSNSFLGVYSGYSNTKGLRNCFFGDSAAFNNNTGNTNVAVGHQALYSNTGGYSSVAVGAGALYKNKSSNVVAIGDSAMYNNNTGYYNTATGSKTLYSNSSGNDNTAYGYYSLFSNTTAYQNTAVGSEALRYNTTGIYNTAVGSLALLWDTSGGYNTAVGVQALFKNSTGFGNTAFGVGALYDNTSGYDNTGLGYGADVTVDNLSNATAVGHNAWVNASDKVRIGNSLVTVVESAAGSWTISDGRFKNNIREDVKGLEFIKLLRPVVYNFDVRKFENHLTQGYPDALKSEHMKNMEPSMDKASQIKQTGFIAQEVAEAAKKIGFDFNGVHAPENPTDNWSLSYEKLVVPLVKAVQELDENQKSKVKSQNDAIVALQKENEELKKEIAELRTMIVSGYQQTAMSNELSVMSAASLQQNVPNPFNHTTRINYTLPQQFSSAKIIITDKAGKVLREVRLTKSGAGSLTVDGSMLSSGAYQYSLYVNGKLIDAKQMMVTK